METEEKTSGKEKCSFAIDPEIMKALRVFSAVSGKGMSDIVEDALRGVLPREMTFSFNPSASAPKAKAPKGTKPKKPSPALAGAPVGSSISISPDADGVILSQDDDTPNPDAAAVLQAVEAVLASGVTQDAFVATVRQHEGKEDKSGGASWRGWRDTLIGGRLTRNHDALVKALADFGQHLY